MLSKYSVKRAYTVLVGVVLVIVLGVVSVMKMKTDLLPDMSLQYALIITTDIGASPEEVETEVTAPIEGAIATTSNIKEVNSMSYNSYSIVTCEYEQNANMDSVVIEIQQKLDQLKSGWDDTVGSPIIMKLNPDMLPIMMAAVDVDDMDKSEITNYVQNELIPKLESVEGVASVSANGKLEEKIVVTMNEEKINALNEKVKEKISEKFVDAQKELDDGKEKVESGQNAMTNATNQMQSGVDQAQAQREQLYKTEADLKQKREELITQRDAVLQVQEGIQAFLESEVYTDTIPALVKGISDLQEGIAMMEAMGMDTTELQGQLAQAEAGLEAINTGLAEQFAPLSNFGVTVNTYEDVPAAAGVIAETIAQMNTGLEAMDEGLEQIAQGKVTLGDAMDTLNSTMALAAIQMSGSSAQLAQAAASLETAQGTLDSAKDSALSGADMNNILSMDTLSGLLVAQNFDMPAGYVTGSDKTQYLVHVGTAVSSMEELRELVLIDMGLEGIDIIRLGDVADIEMQDNSAETYAMINGNPGIIMSLEKQTGYSTGDVTDRVLERFALLEKENSALHFTTLMDQGVYIDIVVKSVVQNMIVGAILAILVLILFLQDFLPTVVIACSIPLSVIAAIVLMYFSKISLNIISMSGLVLGIGMLVDNSIVVIENIYRLKSEGYSIRKAAVEGANQVAGAIFASTLTTVSVYAPIIFTDGITRQLFVDLALVILYTLMASLVVALTFVPAMSSFILKRTKDKPHRLFDAFKGWYGKTLELCLNHKIIVILVSLVLLGGSAYLCFSKGMTFMDMDMETGMISLTIGAKEDETLEFAELTELSNTVMERITKIDGIETVGATAGGGSTMNLVRRSGSDSVNMYILTEEGSKVTAAEIEEQVMEMTKDLDCEIKFSGSSMDYTAYFGNGISIQIKGHDIEKLQDLARKTAAILEEVEGTVDVSDGLEEATPMLKITVDKEKAAKYKYTVAQVFQLAYGKMAAKTSATTITTDIKDYAVYLQTEEQAEISVDDIKGLSFKYKNEDGDEEEIPITDICTIEETETLSTITRTGQSRYLTTSCHIDQDHNVTLVAADIKEALNKLEIPEGYSVEMNGEDETINEAMSQLGLMLLLAVIFIYLIMVAQFQSLKSPFIIMFSIPLAFTGGFLALYMTGKELSVISMLGFIMLAGLIVNNGIVLIDYINQARREGMSKRDAIIDAGKTRVRPILMTVLTTILAMSTSAIGMGDGSEMMQPMAVTIIGGLLYGTILTLIVIPCLYDMFNREKNMVEEEL